jgi:uncharacterized damage-inducible protein DinB
MDANAFRQYYEYHFTENRKIWDSCISSLSWEQFTQAVNYSHGSVRNQLVHIMSADDSWFSELRGATMPLPFPEAEVDDRVAIRLHWNGVEESIRNYLAGMRDEMLFEKPVPEGEDKDLILWQVLLHVVNHGTDHRAQLLVALSDLGVKTAPQDFIFYVFDHL